MSNSKTNKRKPYKGARVLGFKNPANVIFEYHVVENESTGLDSVFNSLFQEIINKERIKINNEK